MSSLQIRAAHFTQTKVYMSQGVASIKKRDSSRGFKPIRASTEEAEPLLVRAARGEEVERPPCWMMRQAGRYQQAYRDLAKLNPSFRKRSETVDLIVEISLQPWKTFKPDGVIIFSDILTPLPAMGISFEIDDEKGPIIQNPITTIAQIENLPEIDLTKLYFVGESLKKIRQAVASEAAVLGFVGAPWTLATYLIEGKSSSLYKQIKTMIYKNPKTLDALLSFLTQQIAKYVIYQIESGAHVIQIFDSWGGQLAPKDWDKWSKPYIRDIVRIVKASHPKVPLVLYINGNGGLLERMRDCGVDVIGLDWTTDMADARRRLGKEIPVQGNIDPMLMFATESAIEEGVMDCVKKAGSKGHILNLGHGVLVGTPEENVAKVFSLSKQLFYNSINFED